jgi:tetratricopeptide (TPR) repeat protein
MAKAAASRKALNAANLRNLGTEALAELLIELAERQPNTKRRLRMELAARVGAGDLAAEIDKRLDMLGASRARVSWRKRPDLIIDLDVQRRMIAKTLSALNADLALDRMWVFLSLAESLASRASDPKGEIADLFETAAADLGDLIAASSQLPPVLAQKFAKAILTDSGAHWASWLTAALPGFKSGLAADLLALLEAQAKPHFWTPSHLRIARLLADAADDADAFIRAVPAALQKTPAAGAEIAQRLLKSGRVEEALAALMACDPRTPARKPLFGKPTPSTATDEAWESAYIEALERSGEPERAQAARRTAFELSLSAQRLRDYVKSLPDFDDVVATDELLAFAAGHHDFTAALRLFMDWPSYNDAAKLIVARRSEIDGGAPEILEWATRLESRYPLAAVLLMRANTLDAMGRVGFDREAILNSLEDIAALSISVTDWQGAPPAEEFGRTIVQKRR